MGSFVGELFANPDHMHILCTLPRTITIADLLRKIKAPTSKWFKQKGVPDFGWQDGYAAFSVSSSKTENVIRYILNQPEHHKKMTFKEELKMFFKEYNVEYDERYVWD